MSKVMVRITYWSQETEESGRWASTWSLPVEDAKNMLERYPHFFPRGFIDEGEQE